MLKKNNSLAGFTLIEVLVATLILLASIASVSLIYRGAFISSERADSHVNIAGVLPSVLTTIRSEIRSKGNVTDTVLKSQSEVWGVSYQWQAQLIEIKSAPERFDVDAGNFITTPDKYKLWQVDLTLEYHGLNKQYQFKELSWNSD